MNKKPAQFARLLFYLKREWEYGRAVDLSLGCLRREETVSCVMPLPSFRGFFFFFFLKQRTVFIDFFIDRNHNAYVSGLKCKHRRNSIFRLLLLFCHFYLEFRWTRYCTYNACPVTLTGDISFYVKHKGYMGKAPYIWDVLGQLRGLVG